MASFIVGIAACASAPPAAPNQSGAAVSTIDPGTRGAVAGVGIESQDIVSMTDQMMRDMLATPTLAGRATPPRIILDAEYFVNESTQRINKNMITDRLRVNLNRASAGRMAFVSRENAAMIAQERELRREGVVDTGTTGMTRAQASGDFRLTGRITSLDSMQQSTGMVSRYNQITFEMLDTETGIIVWSGQYEFRREAADDVVYR
ncbi:lipoprotein YcfM [alpha proteobacterium U9-1i]|nr:lipoprotein YcfM [alpha proteobacterium U9-1i]